MAQTVRRVFPDGDYPQRLQEAFAAFEQADKDERNGKAPELLADETPASETLAGEYRALKAEAEADADEKRRIVVLRAVGRKAWRDLREKHPPRPQGDSVDEETAKADRLAGVNTDSVGDDLLYASVISPEHASRGAFDEWLDEFSEGEFQTMLTDAWRLVNVAQFDPKSLPASATRSSAES